MRKGFSLVELLVAIAIISILVAVIVPAVSTVRRTAHQVQCSSNLKQIGTALNVAAQDNNNRYIPGTVTSLRDENNKEIAPNASYALLLMPYLGYTTSAEVSAARIFVDPLISSSSKIGLNYSGICLTYSINPVVSGSATLATRSLSTVVYDPTHSGTPISRIATPSRIVLVGSAVIQEGTGWGAYSTFSNPTGTSSTTVVPPGSGNTTLTGGTLGGVAYRADSGTAAMFVMVDGSVRIIPKGELTVGNFFPN